MYKKKPRVLVVDDTSTNRLIIEKILTSAGFEVLAAESGPQALALLANQVPDLILLDIVMPGMDGFEVCASIKAEPRLCDVPVIFVTGRAGTKDLVRAFKAGAVDYLTKPYQKAEIKARIKTHIRLYHALLEIRSLRQHALDANPLTHLPGNNSVRNAIREAVALDRPRTVIYCDLDHFKAYNDTYGFLAGDEVIKYTADLIVGTIRDHCGNGIFVGHIGGDDFAFIVPTRLANTVGRSIAAAFDAGIGAYFSEQDRARGFLLAANRKGQFEKVPLISLSLAGVDLCGRNWEHYLQVANTCAEVKKYAKQKAGSVVVFDRRRTAEMAKTG